jgi:hypothetical protein
MSSVRVSLVRGSPVRAAVHKGGETWDFAFFSTVFSTCNYRKALLKDRLRTHKGVTKIALVHCDKAACDRLSV